MPLVSTRERVVTFATLQPQRLLIANHRTSASPSTCRMEDEVLSASTSTVDSSSLDTGPGQHAIKFNIGTKSLSGQHVAYRLHRLSGLFSSAICGYFYSCFSCSYSVNPLSLAVSLYINQASSLSRANDGVSHSAVFSHRLLWHFSWLFS